MSDAGVVIRPITAADSLVEITALLHAAFAPLGAMGLNYTAVDQPVAATERRIARGVCFVAAEGGRIVGTIVVQPPGHDADCAYYGQPHVASAHQLAVMPSHQGRGLGGRLLAQAESWARANGFTELALDTAEPAHHLVALYERRGYRLVGYERWGGKRYRSVLMAKRLDAAR